MKNSVVTVNVEYKATTASKDKLMGYSADQIILDYAFYHELKEVIQGILAKSCVPLEFQIIDDREVLL